MSKQVNGVEAPGVDAQKDEILSLENVEKWLTRDLSVCLSLLNALHTDADLRKQMAIFLHGRYMNSVHKADPNQIKLGL